MTTAAPTAWRLFLIVQLVCLAGGGWSLWQGNAGLAVGFLAAPLQVLLWMALVGDEYRLLVFFAALLPLTGLELLPFTYTKWVMYLGTLGTIAFLRITKFATSPRPETKLMPGERIPLLILGVCVVVAALNAFSRGWGRSELVMSSVRTLGVLFAAWCFGVAPQSLRHVRMLIYVMAASIGLTCVGMFILPWAPAQTGALGGKAIQGLFGVVNLNTLGTIVATLSIVLIGAMLEAERVRTRIGLALIVFITLAALLYSRSRGAWLGFGVAALYVLVRSRSRAFMFFSATCFLILFSFDLFRVSLTSRIGATSAQDLSLWGRFVLWAFAVKVVKANWLLGVGMENFRYVKYVFGYPFPRALSLGYNAHNLYLEMLADLGVVGLSAFLWAIGRAILSLDRLVRQDIGKVNGGYLALGLAGGLIAYATHGLLDALIWHHGAFMLLGVLLGLSASLRRLGGNSEGNSPREVIADHVRGSHR